MKKYLSVAVIVALLPLQGFAEVPGFVENKDIPKAQLDQMLTDSDLTCTSEDLDKAKTDVQAKVIEIKKLRSELELARESNDLLAASKIARNIGFGVLALGGAVMVLSGVVTKIKYGKAFLDGSGMIQAGIGFFMGSAGAIVAAVGGLGELLTNDEVVYLENKIDKLTADAENLLTQINRCSDQRHSAI